MPYRMPGARTVVDYAGTSTTGRRREINEDAWGAVESSEVFIEWKDDVFVATLVVRERE